MVNNSRYWYEFEKESSQKLVTTLAIQYEDSTVVITLPFQIFAEHISVHPPTEAIF